MDGESARAADQDLDPRLAGGAALDAQRVAEPTILPVVPSGESNSQAIIVHDEKPDTVVDDILKAETMAYTGKDFRDKAARFRNLEAHEAEAQKKVTQLEADDPVQVFGIRKRARGQELHRQLDNAYKSRKAIGDEITAAMSQHREDFGDIDGLDMLEIPNEFDRSYDYMASRLEDWAGVLYDHPITDAFREAHPDVEITPVSLAQMETKIRRLRIESMVPVVPSSSIRTGALRLTQGEAISENFDSGSRQAMVGLKMMLEGASDEMVHEWGERQSAFLEAAAAIDEFKDRAHQELVIKPRRNEMDHLNKILDDVRYGVGGKPEDERSQAEVRQPAETGTQEQQSDS